VSNDFALPGGSPAGEHDALVDVGGIAVVAAQRRETGIALAYPLPVIACAAVGRILG